ncbi:hypothetical protein [Kitasatospora sp. NPDC058046]|uniref:hypothetical protein n=1 Tax=Kitasatospora sp. NPDC058046 TaxID=3346312 RepID=UPI0036DBF72C
MTDTPKRWARYSSVEAKLAALVRPVGEEHLEWAGPISDGYPRLKYGGRTWPVSTIAFRLHYGRDPRGTVRSGCGHPHCLAGAHLDDTPARIAHRAAYAALGL